MSVVARRFSACPVRTAADTWRTITDVIAGGNDEIKKQLNAVEGYAASIISDETPKTNAITIIGSGPRLKIYCLYDEDGSVEDANESSISWDLFEGDWKIYFPVEKEHLDWVTKGLKSAGARYKTYEAGTKLSEDTDDENDNEKNNVRSSLTINIEKLKSNG